MVAEFDVIMQDHVSGAFKIIKFIIIILGIKFKKILSPFWPTPLQFP